MQSNEREPDYSPDNKMVVSNTFIRALHPPGMTLNAMKLYRLAITQCRMNDEGFYTYRFRIIDVAKAFNIPSENLYHEFRKMCMSVFNTTLEYRNEKGWQLRHMFKTLDYDEKSGTVVIMLDDASTELFLNLRKNFTQIPIGTFFMFKSKYAIRIYELLCYKMMGGRPYNTNTFTVYMSLEEIRKITRTEEKTTYDQISNVKNKIILPSIRDIESNADWKIILHDVKQSRRIVGFNFECWERNGWELAVKGIIPPSDWKNNPTQNDGQPVVPPKRNDSEDDGQMTLSEWDWVNVY